MNRITILIVSVVLTFGLIAVSCSRMQEDLFSESAAIRLNKSMQATNDLIKSAENGWVMEYFPNPESAGVTYIVKFYPADTATMVTVNKYVPVFKPETGYWQVINDMGPVLSFDSYNNAFHIFADPIDPATGVADGKGLEGDYEFLIGKQTQDEIILKGKKHGGRSLLKRLAEGQDWKGYFDILGEMNNTLFGGYADSKLKLMIDNELNSTLSNGSAHVFTVVPKGGTEIDNGYTLPFIVTDYGLRLATPMESGEKEIQTFRLSDDKNKLISTDAGVNAEIIAQGGADVFSNIINARKYMIFNTAENMMSSSVKAEYDKINTALTAAGRRLEYIGFTNHRDWGVSLAMMSSSRTGSRVEGFIGYTLTQINEEEVTLKFNGFTGKFDLGGQTYYNLYTAKGLVELLEGDYTLSLVGPALTSSTVRFTSKTDSSKWFNLQLR